MILVMIVHNKWWYWLWLYTISDDIGYDLYTISDDIGYDCTQ